MDPSPNHVIMGTTPGSQGATQTRVTGRTTPGRGHKGKRRAPNTLVWTQPRTIPPDMQRNSTPRSPPAATHDSLQHNTNNQKQQHQQHQLTPSSMLSGPDVSSWGSDTMHIDLGDTTDLTEDFCLPDLMQSPALSKASSSLSRALLAGSTLTLGLDELGGLEGSEFPFHDQIISKLTPPGSERDSSLDPSDVKGFNAVHLAAYYGQFSIIRLLLSTCPEDTDAVNDKGQSALHIAAAEGHTDVVRELLDLGANAFLQDCEGQTILHAAASSGSTQIVRLLLDRDPEMTRIADNAGHTALHRAVMQGNGEIVRSLLKSGADPRTTIT